MQYDIKNKKRKVLGFLHTLFHREYGYTLDGCFCSVLDPRGKTLYISWDGWRNGQPGGMEALALTVLHVPESER